jgi:hypothetical protein
VKDLNRRGQLARAPVALAWGERDSNPKELALQVAALVLDVLSRTKMTKYEALEKNAVSEPKILQLDNLQYSRSSRKASLYWETLGLIIDGEIGWPLWVAERVSAKLASDKV